MAIPTPRAWSIESLQTPTPAPQQGKSLTKSPMPTPCGSWCPESSWVFLPSEGCKGFYFCSGGKPSATTYCPIGQLYDQSLNSCIYSELVSCSCPEYDPDIQAPMQRLTFNPTHKSEIWYPDWLEINSCKNDGQHPRWMEESYFSLNRADCCRLWFWYDTNCDQDHETKKNM